MMDIVVNSEGMLSIIHDDPRLDAIVAVEFVDSDMSLFAIADAGEKRFMGRMSPHLRELFQGRDGYIVRLDGWKVVSTRKLQVRVV